MFINNQKRSLLNTRAASINLTNAIPKRVLQISSSLNRYFKVDQICWNRFSQSNFPEAICVDAVQFLTYLRKISRLLLSKRYKIILFDDLRLLPFLVIIGKLYGKIILYNRQEVPTVEAALTLSRYLSVPYRYVKPVVDTVETFFSKKVDGVLTIPVSENENLRIKKWGITHATVWNVPELSSVIPKKNSNIKQPSSLIIYSGAISEENGLNLYIKLIRSLQEKRRGVRLILIGRLWKITEEELRAMILAAGCGDYIEYREWVPYNELTTLLSSADVGLAFTDPAYEKYKYMAEGASRKIFTYMAAGLPVIAGGAFGRTVEKVGAGYYLDYGDLEGMLNAVHNLLENPRKASVMGECGRQAILREFNWEAQRDRVEEVLSIVLK